MRREESYRCYFIFLYRTSIELTKPDQFCAIVSVTLNQRSGHEMFSTFVKAMQETFSTFLYRKCGATGLRLYPPTPGGGREGVDQLVAD